MPPQLSDSDTSAIVKRMLDYDGKPTWKDVVAIAQAVTGHPYSRVALSHKPDIKDAYDLKARGESAPLK